MPGTAQLAKQGFHLSWHQPTKSESRLRTTLVDGYHIKERGKMKSGRIKKIILTWSEISHICLLFKNNRPNRPFPDLLPYTVAQRQDNSR